MTQRINRLASMLLDHFVMCFVLVPLLLVTLILLQLILGGSYQELVGENYRVGSMIFMLIFIIYFLKDSYRGKSIAKRLIGLQVVNVSSNKPANALQCFIRNLVIPLWPLEVLISFFNPTRRLGDLLANTKVVSSEKEKISTIFRDFKKSKFSINVIFIFTIGVIYSYMISILMESLLVF